MGTVPKKIADDVMAGLYEDDMPTKIVKYQNAWGGESYGMVTIREDQDRYRPSEYVRNPETIWTHPVNCKE